MKKLIIIAIAAAALAGCQSPSKLRDIELKGMYVNGYSEQLAIGMGRITSIPGEREAFVAHYREDTAWLSPSTKTHELDLMIVDMPPGTGDVPLTVFQSLPVDGVVVVSSPQELVEMIVSKSVKMARMMKKPVLGIVENMSYVKCPDCGRRIELFGESRVEEMAKKFDIPAMVRLPIDPSYASSVDAGAAEFLEIPEFEEFAAKVIQ